MFIVSQEPDIPYEISVFTKYALIGQVPLKGSYRYKDIGQKLEASFQRLTIHFNIIRENYASLFELLSYNNDNSLEWTGARMTFLLYHESNPEHGVLMKERFASQILRSLEGELRGRDEPIELETFIRRLQNSDLTKEDCWNLIALYESFDEYALQYQAYISEMEPYIKEELAYYKEELANHCEEWKSIAARPDVFSFLKELLHVDLDYQEFEDYHCFPTVFGANSFGCYDSHLFIGLIFDQSFYFYKEIGLEDLSRLLKPFGDLSKFRILLELLKRPTYGKALADQLQLTPATISYHINDLASDGLIEYVPGENKRIYYHVKEDLLHDIIEALEKQLFSTQE